MKKHDSLRVRDRKGGLRLKLREALLLRTDDSCNRLRPAVWPEGAVAELNRRLLRKAIESVPMNKRSFRRWWYILPRCIAPTRRLLLKSGKTRHRRHRRFASSEAMKVSERD